jgi:hypothetical protein
MLLFGSERPMVFRGERLVQRASEQRVARFLARRGVRHPAQLLTLFGLSRAEMVAATGPGLHSTDMNLLPEVRLQGFQRIRAPKEAPVPFLRSAAHFDILPYLDDSVQGRWLVILGKTLQSKKALATSQQAVERLRSIDAAKARELERALRTP